MQASTRRGVLSILLCGILSAGARAGDTPPADRAAALAAQVQAALQVALGPQVRLPDPVIRFAPAGDHYDVTVPLGGEGAAATAQARQGPDGVWAIDGITLPSPAGFSVPAAGGATSRLAVKIAEQDAHAVFDPSRRTPSFVRGKYRAVRLEVTAPPRRAVSHFDTCTLSLDDAPAADGRTDVTESVTTTGYSMDAQTGTAPETHGLVRRTSVALHVTALSLPASTAAAQAWSQVVASLSPALLSGIANPWQGLDRAAAHRLVVALLDLLRGVEITGSADGAQFDGGGTGIDLDHIGFALTAAAPTGLLHASLQVAMDGLSAPAVPLTQGGDLIPRHLALRPVLSGVSMTDIGQLALSATSPDAAWPDLLVQVLALVSHGGIGLGLEDVSLDIGPASFSGALHATVAGLTQNSGEGRLVATGFAALLHRLRELPAAAPLLPGLTALGELSRSEGDQLVWDISLKDGSVLINGVDPRGQPPSKKL